MNGSRVEDELSVSTVYQKYHRRCFIIWPYNTTQYVVVPSLQRKRSG